jgi:hypothetical protein
MCWTLNHQNMLEMAQGHISLSESRMFPQFESNPTGTRVIARRTSVSAVRRGELGSPL